MVFLCNDFFLVVHFLLFKDDLLSHMDSKYLDINLRLLQQNNISTDERNNKFTFNDTNNSRFSSKI